MSPVIVFVTRVLPNGCTVNASPYVTSPGPSLPATWPLTRKPTSPRIPPGFMNATFASPRPTGAVAASCASAITSPIVDSPSAFCAGVRSPWIRPITWFASGAAAATY